ncbi:unnamed protein product [Plutella xylostella]|uniref:(diamondback moth) hypothetical protein n=1 Tax=Plutella xylostella TaxID=51655 RepID=A0A8S4EY78_PLUXY|nr:unnamed protein product [Plutella xylostella]
MYNSSPLNGRIRVTSCNSPDEEAKKAGNSVSSKRRMPRPPCLIGSAAAITGVVQQKYESEVNNEYVIRGNSAILKCSIPSFVADFVTVVSWHDESDNSYKLADIKEGDVVTQYYEAEVVSEYVIRGNTAVLKCNIPSFVADFVKVEAWVGWGEESESSEYLPTDDIVVNQFYEAEILTEYVIRGNAAVLKCSIPSFVADFVKVEAWIDEEGTTITHSEDLVVSQFYVTEAENEYVIRGNAAIVRCKIPSFVSDFVYVESWIMDDGQILTINNTNDADVVAQPYEAEADNEYVIRGNAAIMKCEVPSFVSDFVFVEMWSDSEGGTYYPSHDEAVHQAYEPRVIDEYVLRGNAAIVKCLIPSFVSDYVQVVEWVTDENESLAAFSASNSEDNYVVSQAYTVNLMEENVLRGNSAIMKCHIPSFVSEYVIVSSWIISEDDAETMEIKVDDTSNLVVSQAYTVNLWEENVLRGNAAILKCHIPSFVSEYVSITSWIISEGETDESEINLDSDINLVVSQAYDVKFWEEYVLRGNAAILKCQIPSFVSEYVSVSSWIISEDENEDEVRIEEPSDLEGKYLVLPSGELHIRDVGPEDGYKSYQCRTKHRLTGETRLSATKGRLVITEPVGRVPPKFASAMTTSGFSFHQASSLALLCPAQAFPAPMYRFDLVLEPVGRVSPKFASVLTGTMFDVRKNQSYALQCPAQAFPVPLFR